MGRTAEADRPSWRCSYAACYRQRLVSCRVADLLRIRLLYRVRVKCMTTLKKYGRPAGTLSRREKLQVLIFFVVVVLVILYGMYLGAWSLRQEEGWPEDSLTSRLR